MTTESLSARQRELSQYETQLKKWEAEMKLREAKSSDLQSDVKKLEDYLCRTEPEILSLRVLFWTLQRKIHLLEGPQPMYIRANEYLRTQEPDNHQTRTFPGYPGEDVHMKDRKVGEQVPYAYQEFMHGIQLRVTQFVLDPVERQLDFLKTIDNNMHNQSGASPLYLRASASCPHTLNAHTLQINTSGICSQVVKLTQSSFIRVQHGALKNYDRKRISETCSHMSFRQKEGGHSRQMMWYLTHWRNPIILNSCIARSVMAPSILVSCRLTAAEVP